MDPSRPLGGALEVLWGASTHFALVRHGRARVDRAEVVTPTAELKRLLEDFAPLRQSATEALWVSQWPGTRSGGNGILWVRGRAGGSPPFPLDEKTLWKGWNDWDDLQLFDGDRLRAFVCSHEGFGSCWGDQRLFSRTGLASAGPSGAMHTSVVGVPLDRELWELLKA